MRLHVPPGSPYPERAERLPGLPDRTVAGLLARLDGAGLGRRWRRPAERLAEAAIALSPELAGLDEAGFTAAVAALREQLAAQGLVRPLLARGFALVREASRRRIGLAHHKVQLMGGLAMLDGALAEMDTGEGKTITALLPASLFALAGRPVHVVTVNDYLAERDAEQMACVYEALGLRVGTVTGAQSNEERRAGYAADVTYCTNSTLVFDYLRDRLAAGSRRARARRLVDRLASGGGGEPLFLRGLHVAIVDEADSVLIDEARTPLILSGPSGTGEDAPLYATAHDLADRLGPGDYTVDHGRRSLELTAAGRDRLEGAAALGGLWTARRAREELVEQALKARLFFIRGHQYAVVDGTVQIIDEYTGRIMPDRTWENGLHQMVETKEGCELSGRRRTIARITYQRFFTRYGHLCGMTGTATEARTELAAIYGLTVKRVPNHQRCRRRFLGVTLRPDAASKWDAVASRAAEVAAEGRSVLIGTKSVAASEALAGLLRSWGLAPAVLNAEQSREEAAVVARAGQPGVVTVATNMAGRGTDIRLSREVRERGGLHVILTEYHDSARIDRQLFGRCARQGDPGTAETIVATDDEVFARYLGRSRARLIRAAARLVAFRAGRPGPGQAMAAAAQRRAERMNAEVRRATLREDEGLEATLAFAGQGE